MADDSGLHNKYRPRSLDRLLGNAKTVTRLKGMIASEKYPSAILFTGPPGGGKTTIARAFINDVLGGENVQENLTEINFGADRSIEDIRALIQTARLRPGHGAKRRFFLADEVHQLVSNKPAADAFLKPLEEPVKTTTFLLCSMDPEKFNSTTTGKAMASRCIRIGLESPSQSDMTKFAKRIMKGEGMTSYLNDEVIAQVVGTSNSSFRELAMGMESLLAYYNGLPEKPEQLTTEDVDSAFALSGTSDDIISVRFLVAVYALKYVAAHKELLSVTDPVGFINKVLWLNWFIHNQIVLNEAKHPKVWANRNGWALWNQVKADLKGIDRKLAVNMVAKVTSSLAGLKLSAGSFAVDERILLSARTFDLINQLKG